METTIITIVLALTEVSKSLGVTGKYAILVSIGVGIASGLLFNFSVEGGVQGLIYALTASGLYSGGKAIIEK